jgi:hypothetical protein
VRERIHRVVESRNNERGGEAPQPSQASRHPSADRSSVESCGRRVTVRLVP